jgi:arginyl-tRNA synthetase
MLSEDISILEDTTPEVPSTLEALDDIADIVESIALSLGGAEERDAYLALADEYDAYASELAEDPDLRSAEQNDRLQELEKLAEDAFRAVLKDCPEHIRKLHEAVRVAFDEEEAAEA